MKHSEAKCQYSLFHVLLSLCIRVHKQEWDVRGRKHVGHFTILITMLKNPGAIQVSCFSKAPLQFHMSVVGEVVPVEEQRVYGNSLYFPLNFALILKPLLKVKFIH